MAAAVKLARSVFAAKFAERNFLFSNVIGSNSKILFNRDPAERVSATPRPSQLDCHVPVQEMAKALIPGYAAP